MSYLRTVALLLGLTCILAAPAYALIGRVGSPVKSHSLVKHYPKKKNVNAAHLATVKHGGKFKARQSRAVSPELVDVIHIPSDKHYVNYEGAVRRSIGDMRRQKNRAYYLVASQPWSNGRYGFTRNASDDLNHVGQVITNNSFYQPRILKISTPRHAGNDQEIRIYSSRDPRCSIEERQILQSLVY